MNRYAAWLGIFVALALPPGPYSVTVSKQGFATAVAEFAPPPPTPRPGKSPTGPFALADPDTATHILQSAGFANVRRTAGQIEVEVAALLDTRRRSRHSRGGRTCRRGTATALRQLAPG